MNHRTAGFNKRENSSHFKRSLLFICLIGSVSLCIHSSVQAQTKVLIKDAFFEIDAKRAIDSLYNRNTEAARNYLEPWREKHPEHPIWMLWDGMELWWNVLEDLHDYSNDRKFISMMRRADYEAGQVLRKEPGHPDALIIRAVSNGYIARVHANREDWLTRAQVGRKAYQAHQELMQAAPELPDNHFAEGMKMYYAEYIPEAYPVVKAVSWFFPEGSKAKGLEKLEDAARNGVFARPEANYFLANILLNYEQHYEKAKERFKYLIEQYPNNGYYRRQYLRTLFQLEENDEIITFANETLEYRLKGNLRDDPVLESEVNYWIGRAYYNQRNWTLALPHLKSSVESAGNLVNSRDRDLYALAAYFTGRTLDITGEKREAKKYYEIAADQKSVADVRKRSREYLRNL